MCHDNLDNQHNCQSLFDHRGGAFSNLVHPNSPVDPFFMAGKYKKQHTTLSNKDHLWFGWNWTFQNDDFLLHGRNLELLLHLSNFDKSKHVLIKWGVLEQTCTDLLVHGDQSLISGIQSLTNPHVHQQKPGPVSFEWSHIIRPLDISRLWTQFTERGSRNPALRPTSSTSTALVRQNPALRAKFPNSVRAGSQSQ